MDVGELNVKQLREELAKRELDTKGIKSVLQERLLAAMEAERLAEEEEKEKEEKAQAAAALKRPRSPENTELPDKKIKAEPSEPTAPLPVPVKREPEDPREDKHDTSGLDTKVKKEVKKEDEEEDEEKGFKEDVFGDRSHSCPYLDTINRTVLDFDFEKLCSVTLSNQNVYACLVCGKYFQGRGKGTQAYMHALEVFHHVFLNLSTLKFYCLPDNYEVIDSSLEDITYVLRPRYDATLLRTLETTAKMSRALDGSTYLPGIMGLNNIKFNDYVNVIVQALSRVTPLRNFLLQSPLAGSGGSTPGGGDRLLITLGELMRKLWNPRAFKAHVSPHEFLQAVVLESKKTFQITAQSDPVDFLSWLLNTLNTKLRKQGVNVITDTFQGRMSVTSTTLPPATDNPSPQPPSVSTSDTPFLFLGMDLPPPPLFQDEHNSNLIPQVPLFQLLSKFDGFSEREYKTYKDTIMKKFRLTSIPDYLIFHVKRFTKNTFFTEKNPTIINFPVKNIDLTDYLHDESLAPGEYTYDLVANIVHDGLPGPGQGSYRAHVLHKGARQWFEMQDLHVTDILPEMIPLSESYIQIWERQKKQ